MAETIGSLLIQIQADTAKLNEQVAQVNKRLNGLDSSAKRLNTSLLALGSVYYLRDLVSQVTDATVTFQGWQYTLEAGGLSAKQTSDELAFLQDTAQKLGISIKDTGSAFSRIILTGQAAGMSLQELNQDFAAVTGAMRIFHLSNQQVTRSWLALTEIMSMGKVESRQFTQQLGRDWPGIGALIAKTMFHGKDALEQFQKAMKAGQISSQQFMDAFVQLMSSGSMATALQGAEDSLQAAIGRFHTAWFNLANQANNSNLDTVVSAINDVTATLNDPNFKAGFDAAIAGLMEMAKWAAKAAAGLGDVGNAIAVDWVSMSGASTSVIENTKQEITSIEAQLKQLNSSFTFFPDKATADKIAQLETLLKTYKQALTYEQGHPYEYAAPVHETPISVRAPSLGNIVDQSAELQKSLKKTTSEMDQINKHPLIAPKQITDAQNQLTQLSEFAKEAAKNMQDALANLFMNPTKDGFKGLLHSFVQMIEQMVAQIAAAKLLDSMFGRYDTYTVGVGSNHDGFANFMGSALGSIFGGGKASGGNVSSSNAYLVGENGPELFMPRSNGTIIPNHAMGGSTSVTIDARGAGPDEVAKLAQFGKALEMRIKQHTEYRLQRNAWPTIQ